VVWARCPYLLLFTLLLFYFSTHYAIVWNSFSNFAYRENKL
jgi:hypothetical protein